MKVSVKQEDTDAKRVRVSYNPRGHEYITRSYSLPVEAVKRIDDISTKRNITKSRVIQEMVLREGAQDCE